MTEAMIKLLCFGRLGDLAANMPSELVLSDLTATPANIRSYLQTDSSALANELAQPQVLVAVNRQIVGWQHVLKPGDEVAFLPPVTGG